MVNTLRKLILFDVFLFILGICTLSYFDESSESVDALTGLDFFWIIYIVIYFINLFFLYKLNSISKYLFLFLVVLELLSNLLDQGASLHYDGAVLGDNLVLLINFIKYLNIGMILSLLFFTNLKKEFK